MLPTAARFSVRMLVLRRAVQRREAPWQPALFFDASLPPLGCSSTPSGRSPSQPFSFLVCTWR